MKKVDPRIVDSWPTIQSKIKILHLSPGEWIKGRIEDKSWMFVEEGFQTVQRFYTILLRAPEDILADFLGIESKRQRMLLSAIRRENEATRNYESS